MSDSIDGGQFRYYILPFLVEGITIRVELSDGEVWCYASDVDRNPNNESSIWSFFITGYDNTNIDPRFLSRPPGYSLFIAIEGVNSTSNNFTLNSTTGNTAIRGT